LKGSDASTISTNWITDEFDDSDWTSGNAPFRYTDGTGGIVLSDMQNNYSTLYLRTTFNATNTQNIKEVQISVNYDDGFVIWMNGSEVLRQNAPATLNNNSLATFDHESGTPATFIIDSSKIDLFEGVNTICVQGLNVLISSSDFYFDMSINASLSLPEVSDTIKPVFSAKAGFYNSPFNLTLQSPEAQYNLIYTIDGSNPQSSLSAVKVEDDTIININPSSISGRAATPVFMVRASLVKDGFSPSRPTTKSFIFIENVKTQVYPGGDWPSSSVNDQVIDLPMDPDVVNDSRYSSHIITALTEIPSISLVTDNSNLFDPSTGIFVNAKLHGEEWERECSVEMINPDGSDGFQINAGLRMRGGNSRNPWYPKHAFRLFFRKEYGAGKL